MSEMNLVLEAIRGLDLKFDDLSKTVGKQSSEQASMKEKIIGLEKDNAIHWKNYNDGQEDLEKIRSNIQDNKSRLVRLSDRDDSHEESIREMGKDLNQGLKLNSDGLKSLTTAIEASKNKKVGVRLLFGGIAATILVFAALMSAIAPYLSWKS